MTPTKQIEVIRKMGRQRSLQRFGGVLVALSVALAAAALYTQQAPYVMALVFVAVVTWSAFQTSPHIEAAARALATANRADGSVTIEVGDHWSDGFTYHAVVPVAPSGAWRFEFKPLGWKPVAGEYRATIYWLPDVIWPALVQIDAGVMHPRYAAIWRTNESGV